MIYKISRLKRPALTALVLVFALPVLARAYLDPGSGSMVFQIAMAGLIGGFYGIKRYWSKLCGFFSRKPSSNPETKS
jgi:hypothetical protein